MRGAISRKVLEMIGKGNQIETLPDLLLWVGPTVSRIIVIGGYYVSEISLRRLWDEYLYAINQPT